jgi:hypothetical protein
MPPEPGNDVGCNRTPQARLVNIHPSSNTEILVNLFSQRSKLRGIYPKRLNTDTDSFANKIPVLSFVRFPALLDFPAFDA